MSMIESLRLMCVLAHPDDESFGMGGTLAKYAREGVETYLVTATRGEYGWASDQATYPGPEQLGQRREAELQAAASILQIRQVNFLNYVDGNLDIADPSEVIARIVLHIRRVRPQVVLTFGPDGVYGHPDHIAVSQFATAAILCAADPNYLDIEALDAYRVSKLYYLAVSEEQFNNYQLVFGELAMRIDGVVRQASSWDNWAITTWIDTKDFAHTVWRAITCHQTQLPNYEAFADQYSTASRQLWARQSFYRVFSLVNGGRTLETDLFDGLRE
jgi:LmbE family N-acetylglucosaminyl deacetylase